MTTHTTSIWRNLKKMTETKDLQVVFTDDAQTEVKRTLLDMGLIDVSSLAKDEPRLHQFLAYIAEIFSTSLPELTGELDQDLMRVSRDINLSRLFRNRGIMLFYRLLNENIEGVPVYQYFNNPYTDSPFRNRTEFIDWFSKDAHISRDIIFRNIAAIDRSLELDLSIEQAYEYLNKYAHAFRETLKNVLIWDDETRRKLVGIDPDIALNVAEHVDSGDPERLEMIADLAHRAKDGDESAQEVLLDEMKPSIVRLLDEITDQASAKDAMSFVKHDILVKPEITYRWIPEGSYIEITMVNKSIATTGEEFTDKILSVCLLLDYEGELPQEIVDDVIRRLPIVNRNQIDI